MAVIVGVATIIYLLSEILVLLQLNLKKEETSESSINNKDNSI